MATSFRIAWAALALAFAGSCVLLLDFDPEGKPCGADLSCRVGYVCVKTASSPPAFECIRPDGGLDGGLDGSVRGLASAHFAPGPG
jgi:hypothetical protein